jgi:hypothetical protein
VGGNWLVVVLVAAALLLRWQGTSWPVTITKLVRLAVLFLVVVTLLGIVTGWLW